MSKSDKVYLFLLALLVVVASHVANRESILAMGGLIMLIASNILLTKEK